MSLLEVRDLKKHFPIRTGVFKRTTGYVYAVDGVSFDVRRARLWAWWGERRRQVHGRPHACSASREATGGSVAFEGIDVMNASRGDMTRCARTCRSSSRTRTPRSTRACAYATSSGSG